MYKHSTKDGHSFPECTKAMKRKVTGGGGVGTLFKGISFLHTASLLLHILVWKSTSVERCPVKWKDTFYLYFHNSYSVKNCFCRPSEHPQTLLKVRKNIKPSYSSYTVIRIKRGCERRWRVGYDDFCCCLRLAQSKATTETGARLAPGTELKRWSRID